MALMPHAIVIVICYICERKIRIKGERRGWQKKRKIKRKRMRMG